MSASLSSGPDVCPCRGAEDPFPSPKHKLPSLGHSLRKNGKDLAGRLERDAK